MAIYDFCVVGGGIVGLATAHAIVSRHPHASVILLEKEESLAFHQTGHNSGVIHAGVYYKPGSLKAKLCREGAKATKDFCTSNGIRFETRGKVIVATDHSELERMNALRSNAEANGLETHPLDSKSLKKQEPALSGVAGFLVPETGIVDYSAVAQKLGEIVREKGGEIVCSEEVVSITEGPCHVDVCSPGRTVKARTAIFCAGLQADRMASKAGLPVDFRIVPFRGEYFSVAAQKADAFSALIYPVPDPALPFLGVHFTPTIDGNLIIGPNAVLGFAREGYRKFSFNARDIASIVSFGGMWRLAKKQFRFGVQEFADSLSKMRYLKKCRDYWPDLEMGDLRPWRSGIRAQALTSEGELVHDFIFRKSTRTLHVCNAPSPAATSALPIARMIMDEVDQMRLNIN